MSLALEKAPKTMSKTIHLRRASPTIALKTTRSTQSFVFLAFFLVLFCFVMFAQHLAASVHFDTNLLAVLVDHGFKVGALFLPADNGFRLWLRPAQLAEQQPAHQSC